MLLALDLGNSRIKWCVFNKQVPKGRGYFPTEQFRSSEDDHSVLELNNSGGENATQMSPGNALSTKELMNLMGSVTHLALCSVAGRSVEQALLSHLYGLGLASSIPVFRVVSSKQACGVINHYDQPERLGADRWAALIAARAWSVSPLVVVMAGTATTVDSLKIEGHFLGGTILPGVRLMPKSLYERTANITEGDGSWAEFPTNTADAVASGVLAATAGAIAGMIHNLQQIQKQPVQLLVSGGNSPLLLPRLSALGFSPHYERDLVLQGIALISAGFEE
jgi:type III pantothenate kinase